MTAKTRKSLPNLRTMGSRVGDAEKPQRRFVRLAILELERVRRGKEMHQASTRIAKIQNRLAEIDRQQAELLGEASPAAPCQADAPTPETSSAITITY